MTLFRLLSLSMLAALALVCGCQSKVATPPPPAPDEAQLRAESAFEEGLRLYESGHYFLAEEQFLSPAIWAANRSVQLKSLKYLAFSYCVSERPIQCRFAFERALQIDPAFQLKSAELGHPLWGPVFAQAARR